MAPRWYECLYPERDDSRPLTDGEFLTTESIYLSGVLILLSVVKYFILP